MTKVDCTKDTCRTFGTLFNNGSDLCETLWDGAFMYEPNEEDAYSMAWSPSRTGGINPNSLVNAYVPFPDTCPGAKIDLVRWLGCGGGACCQLDVWSMCMSSHPLATPCRHTLLPHPTERVPS